MNGFERLQEQVKDQKDLALRQTVDYLISRKDMESKYLNEEKTIEGMKQFIREKGMKHARNGWNYITNEVVYAWAIMYFSLPDSILNINKNTKNQNTKTKKSTSKNNETKNNIISLEDAKKEIEKKKEVTQLSLFGGVAE